MEEGNTLGIFTRSSRRVTAGLAIATALTFAFASAASAATVVAKTFVTGGSSSDPYYSAVSPDTKWLAVSNYADDTVGLVDLTTGETTIIAVPSGDSPGGIVFSPDSTTLYVAAYRDHVDVMDVATKTWGTAIQSDAWSETWALSITPDGTKLLVDDWDNDYFYTWTFSTSTLSAEFSTSDTYDILPTSDSAFAYVLWNNGTVKKVQLSDMSEVWSASFEAEIEDADLSPDGEHIYFADASETNRVFDVLTSDQSYTIGTVSGATYLFGAAVSKDGTKLYVTEYVGDDLGNSTGGFIYVLDPADLSVLETIAMGDYNLAVSTDADGCAYVSDYYGDTYQLNDCRPAPELPNTGSSVNPALAGLGVVAVLGGAAAVALVTARRRKVGA